MVKQKNDNDIEIREIENKIPDISDLLKKADYDREKIKPPNITFTTKTYFLALPSHSGEFIYSL